MLAHAEGHANTLTPLIIQIKQPLFWHIQQIQARPPCLELLHHQHQQQQHLKFWHTTVAQCPLIMEETTAKLRVDIPHWIRFLLLYLWLLLNNSNRMTLLLHLLNNSQQQARETSCINLLSVLHSQRCIIQRSSTYVLMCTPTQMHLQNSCENTDLSPIFFLAFELKQNC